MEDQKKPSVEECLKQAYLDGMNDGIKQGQPKEFVICAAIRTSTGEIFRGHRHFHAFYAMKMCPRYKDERPWGDDQGFITSKNRYVDRKEAYRLQKAAGIKSVLEGTEHDDTAYIGGECYSEDLY